MRRFFLIIILALLAIQPGRATAPRKGAFLMYQPDGTSFMATLRGDEFGRVLTTQDGRAVIKDRDGFYKYVRFTPDGKRESSGYVVGGETPGEVLDASTRIPWGAIAGSVRRTRLDRDSARPSRHATRADAPVKRKCIVLLAQFQDVTFVGGEGRRNEFVNLISKEGANSVLDYFNDQFQGQYEFDFTVGPVVTLSKSHDYYGKNENDEAGKDSHPQELVREACELSDPDVDFSLYDDDGDGNVDNVFVIVAGKSEAEGADSDCLWPHQWYVPNLWLDGKRILTYGLSTELTVKGQNSDGKLVWGLCAIGTFCHEYSHSLGLRDYYDIDEEGSGGVSKAMWISTALMDGGNFNNSGATPPAYNALDRECLGIGRPEVMRLGSYTLEPVNENGRYLILENPNDRDEFFLFECRAQKGWDAYIGGAGLAIYHVDMTRRNAGWSDKSARNVTAYYRWQNNEVNCNPAYECADMMETVASAMEVRQVFFPYKTVTSFTGNSDPPFRFNDGTESPFAIAGITRSGDKVSFTVYNSSDIVPNPIDVTSEVYQDAAIITWKSDIQGYDGEAEVSWGKSSGSFKTETVKSYGDGLHSITLEGLSPTTAYTANITFNRGGITGETAVCDFLTKAERPGEKPYIYLEYLSWTRVGGMFPKGVGLPLRVFNAIGEKVGWTYDGTSVSVDGSGYFHPSKSGVLKAVVYHSDGSRDILSKDINIQ